MPTFREEKPLAFLRAAVLTLTLIASGGAWAQPVTALWYQSDYMGAPQLIQAPATSFSMTATSSTLSLNASTASSYVYLNLAAPAGQSFQTGAYEGAQSYYARGSAPGLDVYGTNISYCSAGSGRFTVLEALYDSNFNLVAFAANFQQSCGTATYGEVRINSAVPLTVNKPAGSTAPDPFAFAPRVQAPPSATFVSDATTVYGINAPAPISVAGGEYSVNDGAFTSAPGSVNNRDKVRVRVIASASQGTTTGAALVIGGVAASFNVTTYALGEPITALFFRSSSGDSIGGGRTVEGYTPAWGITATHSAADRVGMHFTGIGSYEDYSLSLNTAANAVLAAGAYEEAARASFNGSSPGLEFFGGYRSCGRVQGRFVVLEAEFGPGTTVTRFAANFEQSCDGGPPLYGEVRFNSAVPLTLMKPAGVSLPDPFLLNSQGPVRAGAIVNSNKVTIYGVTASVPITVSGGEYSINAGAFTSAPGTAQNLDHIVVRLHASDIPGAVTSATLDAGGRAATLSATTFREGVTLTGLYFHSTSGDYIGGGQTRVYLPPGNQLTPTRNYDNGVSFTLNGNGGEWFYLDLAGPNNSQLALGTYEGAQRFPFQATGTPGLSFSGNGAGCNQLAGRFVVRDIFYGFDGVVQRFAADFEQHCEITGPPLFGEIRYNTAVPFTYLLPDPATITSPVAGSILAGPSQTFSWGDASASLYQVWVGNSVGAYDLGYFPTMGTTGTSTTITGLPTDGRTLYVRLYSKLGGTYYFRDHIYVAANTAPVPAAILSPAIGSTLAGASQTFTWNAALGATLYQVWVGNSVGAYDLGYFPTTGTSGTSTTITGLPTDGRTLYVRLYSNIAGTYYFRDFAYVAASVAVPTPAVLTSPAPGSMLAGASQVFQWNAAAGATLYQVWVGSSAGAYDIGYFPTTGTSATTTTITGLPTDGRTLYVRLYSNIGGTYYSRDFTYMAAAPATPTPAMVTVPTPGSTLAGATQTFQWNAAPGAMLYQVWVGNSVGAYDIGYFPTLGTTGTSTAIAGLPTDGRTLYVRLYSNIGGTYYYRDFTYTASGAGMPVPAAFTNLTNGSVLSSGTQLFQWDSAPGATLYQVWLGSSVGSYDVGYFPDTGTTGTFIYLIGLPGGGRTLYARLYSLIGGTYYYRDYTFQAGP